MFALKCKKTSSASPEVWLAFLLDWFVLFLVDFTLVYQPSSGVHKYQLANLPQACV